MIDVVARECVNHVFFVDGFPVGGDERDRYYEIESRDRSTLVNKNGNLKPNCRYEAR